MSSNVQQAAQEKLMYHLDKLGGVRNYETPQHNQPSSDAAKLSREEKLISIQNVCDNLHASGLHFKEGFHRHLHAALGRLLALSSDANQDIRIAADEYINRIIRSYRLNHCHSLIYIFFIEIKDNGMPRTLNTALRKFACLSPFIKPNRCKIYANSLLPVLNAVCQREEESILDTLVETTPQILSTIIKFANENDLKEKLFSVLIRRVDSNTASIKRLVCHLMSACSDELSEEQYQPIFAWIIQQLTGSLDPNKEEMNENRQHGVLLALKHLLQSHIKKSKKPARLSVTCSQAMLRPLLWFIFVSERNHLVSVSIDLLTILLRLSSDDAFTFSPGSCVVDSSDKTSPPNGESQASSIFDATKSQIDIEDNGLLTSDLYEPPKSPTSSNFDMGTAKGSLSGDSGVMTESMSIVSPDDSLSNEIRDIINQSNIRATKLKEKQNKADESSDTEEVDDDEDSPSNLPSHSTESKYSDLLSASSKKLFLHKLCNYLVTEVILARSFHIRGNTRVLTLQCLSEIARLSPASLLQPVDVGTVLERVLTLSHDPDMQLAGQTCLLIGQWVAAAVREARFERVDEWIKNELSETQEMNLRRILHPISRILEIKEATYGMAVKLAVQSVGVLANCLLHSSVREASLVLTLIRAALDQVDHNYRLVKRELISMIGQLDFCAIKYLEMKEFATLNSSPATLTKIVDIQSSVVDILIAQIALEDSEIHSESVGALLNVTSRIVLHRYPLCHTNLTRSVHNLFTNSIATPNVVNSQRYLSFESYVLGPLLTGCTSHIDSRPIFETEALTKSGHTDNLHYIVSRTVDSFLQSDSKPKISGYVRALLLLMDKYPPIQHPTVWGIATSISCDKNSTRKDSTNGLHNFRRRCDIVTLLNYSLSLLNSSTHSMVDLSLQSNLLILTGRLILCSSLHKLTLDSIIGPSQSSAESQSHLRHCQIFMKHVVRLLCISWHVMNDQPAQPTPPKVIIPNLTSSNKNSPSRSLSSGRRSASANRVPDVASASPTQSNANKKSLSIDLDENPGKGANHLGSFYNVPFYMKLHDLVKQHFKTYMITSDLSGNDKFEFFLESLLTSFNDLLEVHQFEEFLPHSEELLAYFSSLYKHVPVCSIRSVRKLLRAVFGMNLSSQWDETLSSGFIAILSNSWPRIRKGSSNVRPTGEQIEPSVTELTSIQSQLALNFSYGIREFGTSRQKHMATASLPDSSSSQQRYPHQSLFNWLRKSEERRKPTLLQRDTDRNQLGNYIRRFEPIVIRALKHYSASCNIGLQSEVVQLLTQLVNLRVNYCQLDSEKRFLSHLLDQINQLSDSPCHTDCAAVLLPSLFQLLTLLTYERSAPKSNEPMVSLATIYKHTESLLVKSGLDHCRVLLPCVRHLLVDLYVQRPVWIHSYACVGHSLTPGSDSERDMKHYRQVLLSLLTSCWPGGLHCLELMRIILEQGARQYEDCWIELSRELEPSLWKHFSSTALASDLTMNSKFSALQISNPHDMQRVLAIVSSCSASPSLGCQLRRLFLKSSTQLTTENLPELVALKLCLIHYLLWRRNEEQMLSQILELKLTPTNLSSLFMRQKENQADPLIDLPKTLDSPERIFARDLLEMHYCVLRLLNEFLMRWASIDQEVIRFCSHLLGHLQLCFIEIITSGDYPRVSDSLRNLLISEKDFKFNMEVCSEYYIQLTNQEPFLLIQWCEIVTHLATTQTLPAIFHCSMWNTLFNKTDVGINASSVLQSVFPLYLNRVVSFNEDQIGPVIQNHFRLFVDFFNSKETLNFFLQFIQNSPELSQIFLSEISQNIDLFSKSLEEKNRLITLAEKLHPSTWCLTASLLLHWLSPSLQYPLIVLRVNSFLQTQLKNSPIQVTENHLGWADLLQNGEQLSKLKADNFSVVSIQSTIRQLTESGRMSTPPFFIRETIKHGDLPFYRDLVSSLKDHSFHPLLAMSPKLWPQMLQHLSASELDDILDDSRHSFLQLPGFVAHCLHLGWIRTCDTLSNPERMASLGVLSIDPLFTKIESLLFSELKENVEGVPISRDQIRLLHQLCSGLDQYFILLDHMPIRVILEDQQIDLICHFLCGTCQMIAANWNFCVRESFSFVTSLLNFFISAVKNVSINEYFTASPLLHSSLVHLIDFLFLTTTSLNKIFSTHSATVSTNSSQQKVQFLLALICSGQLEAPDWSIESKLTAAIIGVCRFPRCLEWILPLSVRGEDSTGEDLVWNEVDQWDCDTLVSVVTRLSLLGCSSRDLFQEAWTALMKLIVPSKVGDSEVCEGEPVPFEDFIEQNQCRVVAIRALTQLFLSRLRKPDAGNSLSSRIDHRTRFSTSKFMHTRLGSRLSMVHSVVVSNLLTEALADTNHCLSPGLLAPDARTFDCNLERRLNDEYGPSQLSIPLLIQRAREDMSDSSSGAQNLMASCLRSLPLSHAPLLIKAPDSVGTNVTSTNGKSTENNCLCRGLLSASLDSLVVISDLFNSMEQVSWAAHVLREVGLANMSNEDELLNPSLVRGYTQTAILLYAGETHPQSSQKSLGQHLDTAIKWTEASLENPLLVNQEAGLYAALMLLQVESLLQNSSALHFHCKVITYLERSLSNMLAQFNACIKRSTTNFDWLNEDEPQSSTGRHGRILSWSSISYPTVSERYQLLVLSASVFYCERHPDSLKESEILSLFIKVSKAALSPVINSVNNASDNKRANMDKSLYQDPVCSIEVYLCLFRGLERLVLTERLPKLTIEVIFKVCLERLDHSNSSPLLSFPAIGLFLTCLYTAQANINAATVNVNTASSGENGDLALMTLERLSSLTSRMENHKKPLLNHEAHLMAAILPTILLDCAPIGQALNRSISRFLAIQRTHLDLAAQILFKVFDRLQSEGHSKIVREWVLISLPSVLTTKPTSLALIKTTLFLCASSNNSSIKAIFPLAMNSLNHILGQSSNNPIIPDETDNFSTQLLSIVSSIWFRSLESQEDKKLFINAFQAAQDLKAFENICSLLTELDN